MKQIPHRAEEKIWLKVFTSFISRQFTISVRKRNHIGPREKVYEYDKTDLSVHINIWE